MKRILINRIFELGREIGVVESLKRRKLNDLNEGDLQRIIKLREDNLKRRMSK